MPVPPRSSLQYREVLDKFPLHIRNAIYAKSEYRNYKKGEYVFRDGEDGPFNIGCVMSGRLRILIKSREGKELLPSLIEKGEIFGEMSAFDGMPRAVDVVADEPSTVMVLKYDDFVPLLLACPEAALAMLRITCRRMRTYVRTVELIALQNVKQKLVRHLLHLAQDYGARMDDGSIVIDSRLSQSDIGLQIGISRESVNKHLNSLAEAGFLAHGGESITLCDVEGLKQTISVADP